MSAQQRFISRERGKRSPRRHAVVTKAIQQAVRFRVPPAQLFDIYLDSRKHSDATGAPAQMSRKVDGKFTAWGGALRGRNLDIIPGRMIVQAWRARHWASSDPDSVLVLRFSKVPGGAQIDLAHVNVPRYDHKGVSEGWPKYYWKPWKKYLKQTAKA
jgi:activator of HSP90 ATPase